MSLAKSLILKIWRTIVPKRARNSLRLWTLLETPDRAPELIDDFDTSPVVVLAPHPDDEIIGPGGTIARHAAAGAPATFVVLTTSPDAATRQSESRAAAEVVGVKDLLFLDAPDGALADTEEMVAHIAQILAEKKAAIVYLPSLTDYHRDHWGANRILRKALDRLSPNLLIRGYEIWSPLPANRMVDITSTVEKKRQAIAKFASQTSLVDYSRTILGLNAYRSMMRLQGSGYAEAFLQTTPDEYRELFDKISLHNRA
jgi:LmbE family N-acetylglucosaminyl deacetylase